LFSISLLMLCRNYSGCQRNLGKTWMHFATFLPIQTASYYWPRKMSLWDIFMRNSKTITEIGRVKNPMYYTFIT